MSDTVTGTESRASETATFPIYLFEEHSSTLPVWWKYKEQSLTAVYLDAHLDLQEIDRSRLERLAQCQTADQVAALEAPNHLDISDRYCFGIENFLHAAAEMKLIHRLVWVAPPHVPRTLSDSLFAFVQKMEGVTFAEMTSFAPTGKSSMGGTLLGLDITICHFDDLAHLDIPSNYLLDIDIDYFVKVPEDRLWAEPGVILKHIVSSLGNPVAASISRAVNSGFTPLKFRFVGDYLKALLNQDDKDVMHYLALCHATIKLDQGKQQESAEIARDLILTRNECAASLYLLSLASDDASEVRHVSSHAASIDENYQYDFCREICGFPHRHRPVSEETIKSVAQLSDTVEYAAEQRKQCDIALSQFYAWARQPAACWSTLKKYPEDLGDFSLSALALATHLLTGSEPGEAVPLLKVASAHEKTRTEASLYLGDLAMRTKDYAAAETLYSRTIEFAPAWLLPKERLINCYSVLKKLSEKNALEELVTEQKKTLDMLVSNQNVANF